MAPTRRPGEEPLVQVDPAPAYEMLQALATLTDVDDDDTYEVGGDWLAEIRSKTGDELLDRIRAASFGEPDTFTHLIGLAYETPAPRDCPTFLEHLRTTDPQQIKLHLIEYYTREARRMTPLSVMRAAVAGDPAARDEFLRSSHPEYEPWTTYLSSVLDADEGKLRDDLVSVLTEWYERVWKAEALGMQPILERDAAAKRALLPDRPMEDFVREATNGVEFLPRPGIERLVMIPSVVRRPLVAYVEYCDAQLIVYPVADESLAAGTDAPPPRLVRLSKALGDEKRLRILRALADGEKTLMELAEMFGVAKTTMHHHMIILRSAGLVTIVVGQKRYRLRQEALPDVGALLGGYLGGPDAGSESPRRRSASGS